jgi:hypothetical protein
VSNKKHYIRIYLQGPQTQGTSEIYTKHAFIKHTKYRLKEYIVNQKN